MSQTLKTIFTIMICSLILLSCQQSNQQSIVIPKSYDLQIRWGGFWGQNINYINYGNGEDSINMYVRKVDYSLVEQKKFGVTKEQSDSLFLLLYQSTRNFDVLDTVFMQITDGANIDITISANNKILSNAYGTYMSHTSTSPDIRRIIEFLERIVKDEKLFY